VRVLPVNFFDSEIMKSKKSSNYYLLFFQNYAPQATCAGNGVRLVGSFSIFPAVFAYVIISATSFNPFIL